MDNYNKSKDISKQIIDIMKGDNLDSSHLEEWLNSNKYSCETTEELTCEKKLSNNLKDFSCPELKIKSKSKLIKNIERSNRITLLKRSLSAAAILAVSFMVANNFNDSKSEDTVAVNEVKEVFQEPTLILSSGKKVSLTMVDTINDNQAVITRKEGSLLSYNINNQLNRIQSNTLIVPHKCTYSVVLSDGTVVKLNASGKLTYPVAFSKNSREVTLEGEAYFEVSKSKTPFIVHSQGASIKVYGTKFNVNSYQPNVVKTMLFEGCVGVSSTISKEYGTEYIMKPNQISEIRPSNGRLTVGEFNPNEYKRWTDGYFYCNGGALDEFLTTLSKWYDVEFSYINSTIKSSSLVGVFKNNMPIEDILGIIENVLEIKFIKKEGGYMIN